MSNIQYPGDAQFGNLIQAATAAEIQQQFVADPRDHDVSQNVPLNTSVLGKRTRSEDEDNSLIDTQLGAHSHEGPATPEPPQSTTIDPPPLQNSASILYREASEKSKKYSRKVGIVLLQELQMASHNYLQLMTSAKAYMLDDTHMERRDVIGQKKDSNDTDAAKVRLYHAVEGFLTENDNGERLFGQNASVGVKDAPPRTFFWPEDKYTIIKLCMPVFRKMVTNERQRVYAAQSRKNEIASGTKRARKSAASQPAVDSPSTLEAGDEQDTAIDQTLGAMTDANDAHDAGASNGQANLRIRNLQDVVLHMNLLSDDANTQHRLKPKWSLASASVMSLSDLVAEVNNKCGLNMPIGNFAEDGLHVPMIKALLPEGLVRIKDDGTWMMALVTASMVDWMDAELKVIIEINPVLVL